MSITNQGPSENSASEDKPEMPKLPVENLNNAENEYIIAGKAAAIILLQMRDIYPSEEILNSLEPHELENAQRTYMHYLLKAGSRGAAKSPLKRKTEH